MTIPFNDYNIDPGRTLTEKQQRKVRSRFLRAQMRPAHVPEPSLAEVRWSEHYGYVYVQKTSGLIACGFESMFPDHKPVAEDQNWAIYANHNPAARSLLGAIGAVLEDYPFASLEPRTEEKLNE